MLCEKGEATDYSSIVRKIKSMPNALLPFGSGVYEPLVFWVHEVPPVSMAPFPRMFPTLLIGHLQSGMPKSSILLFGTLIKV